MYFSGCVQVGCTHNVFLVCWKLIWAVVATVTKICSLQLSSSKIRVQQLVLYMLKVVYIMFLLFYPQCQFTYNYLEYYLCLAIQTLSFMERNENILAYPWLESLFFSHWRWPYDQLQRMNWQSFIHAGPGRHKSFFDVPKECLGYRSFSTVKRPIMKRRMYPLAAPGYRCFSAMIEKPIKSHVLTLVFSILLVFCFSFYGFDGDLMLIFCSMRIISMAKLKALKESVEKLLLYAKVYSYCLLRNKLEAIQGPQALFDHCSLLYSLYCTPLLVLFFLMDFFLFISQCW